jgi:hypothetical protein
MKHHTSRALNKKKPLRHNVEAAIPKEVGGGKATGAKYVSG